MFAKKNYEWKYYKTAKIHGWLTRHTYLLVTLGGNEHSNATEPVPKT